MNIDIQPTAYLILKCEYIKYHICFLLIILQVALDSEKRKKNVSYFMFYTTAIIEKITHIKYNSYVPNNFLLELFLRIRTEAHDIFTLFLRQKKKKPYVINSNSLLKKTL